MDVADDDDDDRDVLPVRRVKKSEWARLSLHEKEDKWLQTHGYNYDPGLLRPITTVAEAMRVYARRLDMKPLRVRALARRAYLAALQGGRCRMDLLMHERSDLPLWTCDNRVRDFRFLRFWEFNHIHDRATYGTSGAFVISGTDCANRKWDVVLEHCMEDTILLCRECHHRYTNLEKEVAIQTNRQLLDPDGRGIRPGRDIPNEPPDGQR